MATLTMGGVAHATLAQANPITFGDPSSPTQESRISGEGTRNAVLSKVTLGIISPPAAGEEASADEDTMKQPQISQIVQIY